MSDVQVTPTRISIPASASNQKLITAFGDTVYYGGSSVTSTSYTGTLTTGQQLKIHDVTWFVTSPNVGFHIPGGARLAVVDAPITDEPLKVVAHTPSDADFDYTPANGTQAANSTTDILYYRKAGTFTPQAAVDASVLHAENYGALFDNATDDTAAIQAALDAALVTTGGLTGNDRAARIVQMPPGKARVLGTLTLPTNVWLRGHGPSGTYLYRPGGGVTTPVIQSGGGVQHYLSDFGIISDTAGADLVDLSATGTGGASILSDGRVVMRDMVLVGGRDGVTIQSGSNTNESRFVRVTSQRAGRYGFNVVGTDLFFDGCTAGAGGQAGANDGAFYIFGANTRIYGCKAYGNNGPGFSLQGAARHEVVGCEAQDCNGNGFALYGSDGNVVTGCTADSCSGVGFFSDPVRVDSDIHDVLSACSAVNRSGGAYTLAAAYGGKHARVRGLNVSTGLKKLQEFGGASESWYDSGYLDIHNRFGAQAVAYAASITPDPWEGRDVYVGALTGALTVARPAASSDPSLFFPKGMRLTFYLVQDGTGGRVVTWNAAFKLATGALGTTASTTTIISFAYEGSQVWREVSRTTSA